MGGDCGRVSGKIGGGGGGGGGVAGPAKVPPQDAVDVWTTHGLENVLHDALPPIHAPTTIRDRKSTRLNSSHGYISYAVFCLKKKKRRPGPCLRNTGNSSSCGHVRCRSTSASR